MTIAYENSLMHLATGSPAAVPDGCLAMDDSRLDDAFATLISGHDVTVSITHGMRHLARYLSSHYRCVKAAGGLVSSPDGYCLMILRNGRWDLPKGMVEPGETLPAAARREVREETGVDPATVGPLILKTYHIYDKYGGWHLKQTSWFAMTAPRQETRPQTDEDIAQALWVDPATCRKRLLDSYASLRLLAAKIQRIKQ